MLDLNLAQPSDDKGELFSFVPALLTSMLSSGLCQGLKHTV